MLANHVVLCYLNDDFWYDLHPSAIDIPGIKEAMEKETEEPG